VFCTCWQPAVQPAAEDSATDKELRASFKKIAGEDMEIDAYELQDILNAAFLKSTQHTGTLFCIIGLLYLLGYGNEVIQVVSSTGSW